jgi:glycosyltransferase involved in cell wall biosynthesis
MRVLNDAIVVLICEQRIVTLFEVRCDGPLRAELESEASTLGIDSRVRFVGFVKQSRLPALYTAADVMVLPSEYEPFGVVVNEAMCCGCPVISSDSVGPPAT